MPFGGLRSVSGEACRAVGGVADDWEVAPMRVLVLTSCTGEKSSRSAEPLKVEDFDDPARLQAAEERLAPLLGAVFFLAAIYIRSSVFKPNKPRPCCIVRPVNAAKRKRLLRVVSSSADRIGQCS